MFLVELPKEKFASPEENNIVVSGLGMTWLKDEHLNYDELQTSRFLMASEQQKCLDLEKHCKWYENETHQYKDGIICSCDPEDPNDPIIANSACHGDGRGNTNEMNMRRIHKITRYIDHYVYQWL